VDLLEESQAEREFLEAMQTVFMGREVVPDLPHVLPTLNPTNNLILVQVSERARRALDTRA
jgi:hypothetical protein